VGVIVTAEQVLNAGARRRQPNSQGNSLGRHQLKALEHRGVALGELPSRGQRPGAGQQELDP
jgi:hypothetical protein